MENFSKFRKIAQFIVTAWFWCSFICFFAIEGAINDGNMELVGIILTSIVLSFCLMIGLRIDD